MFKITKLLQAALRWRHRRGPKTAARRSLGMEQLDHRQLLSVNFTGNVAVDFPATESPGVVIFNSSNTPGIQLPDTSFFGSLIPTSGYAISEIRVSYDSTDDTLSVGFGQPPADIPSNPTGDVIAGDADDNGNAGNVNPAVLALDPFFVEYPALGGQDIQMFGFLDLNGSGVPDVVAGLSPNQPPLPPNMSSSGPNPVAPKPYEVAQAIPNAVEPMTGIPSFGTLLSNNTGNVYLQNSAAHPNLEFSITHFSQLYLAETGHALAPSSVIGVGAFAGSDSDGPISDSHFPENTFTLSQATVPVTPPSIEPSPPILINPHEHRIIDTHHRDLVRVSIFGTSGFPVSQINPATVELDGVHAVARINRKVQRDEFPFSTYVFVADQLNLPAGLTTATLTGQTYSGVTFQTQKDVLNIPDSARVFGRLRKYMGGGSLYERLEKVEKLRPNTVISLGSTPVSAVSRNPHPHGVAKIKVDYTPKLAPAGKAAKVAEQIKVRPVVAVPRDESDRDHKSVPTRVKYSMEHYLA
jgi:hypothetical protein